TLSANATELVTGGGVLPFRLVPKIPLNRSYFDPSSARFFSKRAVTARGTAGAEGFTVRTLWPEDFRLTAGAPHRALPATGSPAKSLRGLMREENRGGAQSPFVANTLWQRGDGQADGRAGGGDWSGRTVLAFMVNGAQGDDDEAHGGHFAIVTGCIETDGSIGNWLVNDFYTLDAESEKGILAAPVTLDNYLADLNAGQSWYRPSYMVVAVLSIPRAAELVQSALGRVYNQFYRHQLSYYHPDQNCTSISIDTMRALGWDVPERGPTSRLLAVLGFPFLAVREGSIAKAKLAFDYLVTDQTRMMPAAALEEIFGGLLALGRDASTGLRAGGPLERMLAADLDSLAYLRFPQIPSSRALGAAPAVTTREYRMMVPDDPALAKIVPVPPRPFPGELRDPDLIPPPLPPSEIAAMVWGVVLIVGIPWVAWRLWRRWRGRDAAT
ncbi:MAG: hypothetical protein GZ089_09755, partial [Aromatoleum sp.]|nr:hypothetical protein [Aromatoleum sp.]